jgi:hypothetical protein
VLAYDGCGRALQSRDGRQNGVVDEICHWLEDSAVPRMSHEL